MPKDDKPNQAPPAPQSAPSEPPPKPPEPPDIIFKGGKEPKQETTELVVPRIEKRK